MSSADTWNRKLWPKIIKNTESWSPMIPEVSLLWVPFVGSSVWPKGYWMHHKLTSYLDVQRVDKGDLIVTLAKEKYLIPEKTTVLIPPGEHTLAVGPSGQCKKRHLGISGTILTHYLGRLGFDKITLLPTCDDTEFDDIFAELFRMAQEKTPENVRKFAAFSYHLLLFLSSKVAQLPFPEELLLAKSFIDWNFSSPITLESICQSAKCGKTTLGAQFRKHLKTSPIQYLIAKRMEYARHLLKDLSLPIKTVSQRCGFTNQLYFSNAFRKHFACSPREYRTLLIAPDA